jgi:hypothetical protein
MSRRISAPSAAWTAALVGLAYTCTCLLSGAAADTPKVAKSKDIDLAICLDTSNSMDGLIGSAKQKLWDIVNELAKAKPTPNLRVALFSYGNDTYDPKVGWVRKDLDLTADLDKMSEKLFGLTTKGGTEFVARVCRDAIEQLQWSQAPGALKIIFVCGNEPADQDKEVHLKDVAEQAARKGIVINTIYCGNVNHAETKGWREFAVLAEGRFACIDQEQGTVAVATPWDKELTELGGLINKTFCFCGKDAKLLAENQVAQDNNALKLSLPSAAGRAASKATGLYRFDENDLVEKLKKDPQFDVKKVSEDELTDEMKKMTPEQREKHVKEMVIKRDELQKRISELNKKREEHLAAERKKKATARDQALDEAVRVMLCEQARKKGVEIHP